MFMTSDDTLSLVLETVSVVVKVDKGNWMTAELANSLVLAVLEVWHENNKGTSLYIDLAAAYLFHVRSDIPFHLDRYTGVACLINKHRRVRDRCQTSSTLPEQCDRKR